ncbi:Zinc finger and SCAN domain-containing protein 12 [Pseudolycoriella hygida]|uniref:Zinc finger and SCAN domain-containing protein 12 n=1 Tax=Pseudolycoriella hygida TaxID=35572 RepID=A0A9Q0S412_9DIPT|nr:Zinc finger and SCAN domain-containing protein 12 [Pseudolycoriella hygida]
MEYNHMMDTDYGNMVYGSGIPNQMHQNLPTEGLIMSNADVAVKDVAQYPSRETIIASNLTNAQVDGVYQATTNLDNGQQNISEMAEINQFINSANDKVVAEGIVEGVQQQQIQPIAQNESSAAIAAVQLANDLPDSFVPETGTTTKLEIEHVPPAEVAVSVPVESTSKKDNEVDQNQCRVCLSKDNLINIFSYESKSRICDVIMNICTVKIIEKDFLPHYICAECLDKLKIASEFKLKCETTDTELRKKLKRSKNKVRGSGRFLLIDCEMSSGSEVDDNKDDDEFQISDVVESDPDSDASFKIGKRKSSRVKKKSPPKRKAQSRIRTPSAKAKAVSSTSSASKRSTKSAEKPAPETKRIKHDVVYIEALPELSDDEEEVKDVPKGRARRSNTTYSTPKPKPSPNQPSSSKTSKIPHKKRAIVETIVSDDDDPKPVKEPVKPREHICSTCNKTLPSWNALKEHRKSHSGETFACNICNKPFKQRVSLDAHIQKHKEDESRTCKPCNKPFASKLELRKHQQAMHESQFDFECNTCKRKFTAKARLDKHKEGKCPGFDTSTKKKSEVEVSSHLGRDLFKCVAPLTTTYWSDSFSE